MVNICSTSELSATQRQAILSLWNAEYPVQLAYAHPGELDSYLASLAKPVHYFAEDGNGRIVGWAFTFTREAERWFAIIVDSEAQGRGVGKALLDELKKNECTLNGWATDHDRYFLANGKPYRSPVGFYIKSGFSVLEDKRLEIEKLSAVAIKWQR